MSDRADWLAWRRAGIGASDVPAILGISPWSSPWAVFADKAGLLPDEDNEVMEFGRYAEHMVAPWFHDRTGLHVAGEQTQCEHPKYPHHRCTVDGFVGESEQQFDLLDALGVLEIKTTGPGKRWDPVPAHIQAQVQWQLHVTGYDHAWVPTLHYKRFEIYEISRDQADIDLMIDRVDDFWERHVLPGVPPPVDGSDATLRALVAVYPEHEPGEQAPVDSHLVSGLEGARVDKRAAEDDEKRYKAALLAQLGDAEIGVADGTPIVTARSQTRKTTCRACGHVEETDPFRVLRPVRPKETTA